MTLCVFDSYLQRGKCLLKMLGLSYRDNQRTKITINTFAKNSNSVWKDLHQTVEKVTEMSHLPSIPCCSTAIDREILIDREKHYSTRRNRNRRGNFHKPKKKMRNHRSLERVKKSYLTDASMGMSFES